MRICALRCVIPEQGGRPRDRPIDFFGDGTRIPLIVVSRFSRGVGVVHTYADHVSFDKFVEANWRLPPISARSRDNLPNPVTAPGNPYVPVNSPAIGNLMPMSGWEAAGRPHYLPPGAHCQPSGCNRRLPRHPYPSCCAAERHAHPGVAAGAGQAAAWRQAGTGRVGAAFRSLDLP